MPAHPILPQARRAALEAAFDEALAEVRAAKDVALLQECRSVFRARVPFHLRAYVAAALALKGAGASGRQDKRGRSPDPNDGARGRDDRSRPAGDKRKDGRPADEPRQAPARAAKQPKKEPVSGQRRGADVRDEAEAAGEGRDAREPREVRENRYRGEGVTLFVSAGRRQRFYARVAIKILLETPGVADENVGDIRTMDNYSFIVVDPAVEDLVVAALTGYDFKGRILAANRARKRGEPAPRDESAPRDDRAPRDEVGSAEPGPDAAGYREDARATDEAGYASSDEAGAEDGFAEEAGSDDGDGARDGGYADDDVDLDDHSDLEAFGAGSDDDMTGADEPPEADAADAADEPLEDEPKGSA